MRVLSLVVPVSLLLCVGATASKPVLLKEASVGSPNCDTFIDCGSCASAKTWTGSHCRY